jgi:hypothetical protein
MDVQLNESGQPAKRRKRRLELIADFTDGFAADWAFAVPKVFRNQLDIRLTERVKDKKSSWVWTQGNRFSFDVGHVFYDTPLAYHLSWNDALQVLRVALQVQFANPMGYDEQEPDGLYKGAIWFKVYQPNENATALVEVDSLACNQVEFVQFLKNGLLRGELIYSKEEFIGARICAN